MPVRRLTSFVSNLADDAILVQLGSPPANFSEEQRNRWGMELRELLKRLRSTGIKDATVVLKEITDFRRQFFDDPSRVLNL